MRKMRVPRVFSHELLSLSLISYSSLSFSFTSFSCLSLHHVFDVFVRPQCTQPHAEQFHT